MISLDISQLAPDVAALLVSRGSDVPSLQWAKQPNRGAKASLDAIDETKLFACAALADETMASGVRALLYLWNGWPGECAMYAQAAPEKERWYLSGLCERQAGHPDVAKECFAKVNGHTIYESLLTYANSVVSSVEDRVLKRFTSLLEMDQVWEPYLFIDTCEQARAGKCSEAAEVVIRQLQCREFELLFAHCYQEATGKAFSDKPRVDASAPRRPARKVKPQRSTRSLSNSYSSSKSSSAKPAKTSSGGTSSGAHTIRIRCPRCDAIISVPESSRGQQRSCDHCGAHVMVPQKTGVSSPISSKSGLKPSGGTQQITIVCPKCTSKIMVPESSRGQKAKCQRCGAVFMVPRRESVGSA